jgi:hypothetical protein
MNSASAALALLLASLPLSAPGFANAQKAPATPTR